MAVSAAQRTARGLLIARQASGFVSRIRCGRRRKPALESTTAHAIPFNLRVGHRPEDGTGTFGTVILPVPTGRKGSLADTYSGYLPFMSWISGVSDDQHATPVAVAGLARIRGSNDA